jgi:hypothetical protein
MESSFNERAQATPELMEEVKALPTDQREYLREVSKSDLYALSKGILGYKDLNPDTHGAFCRFFEGDPKLRRLGLMPRAHLKSTIATIADSIRLVLLDPNEARILIAGETATQAEKFLSELKGHWEKNELLRNLFPELVPPRLAGPGVKWSNSVASIVRARDYRVGSWNTIGVGGAVTGDHYNRIKCDDLIGLEAARSPATMAAAIAWVSNIDSLLIDQNVDVIDFVGTRWSRTDLYAFIMRLYGSRLSVFLREAIEDGKIIFPQKHTLESFETMQRETPLIWYAQYCNNPLAGGQNDFPAGSIQTYSFNTAGDVVLQRDGVTKVWKLEDLDRIITADPNSGSLVAPDTAAIVVSGISPDDEVIVLHTWSGRSTPSAFVDKIFDLWKRWRPRVVGIEQAGQQNTRFYFDKKAEEEEVYIRVVPLKPKNRNKIDRIRTALQPLFGSRKVYMLSTQTVLRKAADEFPDTDPIDELDALAYGTEEGMWRKPMRYVDMEENQKVLRLIVNRRNKRTGY